MPDMPSILDKIVAAKREELADAMQTAPLAAVRQAAAEQPRPISLADALTGSDIRLIAEVKKASPSRGLLSPDFDPVRLAETYVANGAAAVSCLTDPRFQGELAHLSAIKRSGASAHARYCVKTSSSTPTSLRSPRRRSRRRPAHRRHPGAALLRELLETAQSLGMQCLVEVHDEGMNWKRQWKRALKSSASTTADLHTFTTDLAVTQRLAPMAPRDRALVSESGIFTSDDLRLLERVHVNAVLVGEAIVTAPDVAAKVRELSGKREPSKSALPLEEAPLNSPLPPGEG